MHSGHTILPSVTYFPQQTQQLSSNRFPIFLLTASSLSIFLTFSKLSILLIPISVYSKCFLFDIVSQVRAVRTSSFSTSLHCLSYSRLHRYYSNLRLPANHLSHFLFGCSAYRFLHTPKRSLQAIPVGTSLLYYMNSSHQHRLAYASIATSSACMLTSAQTKASSRGSLVFRCSMAIPIAMLFTLRNIRCHIPRKTRFRFHNSRFIRWAFPALYVKYPLLGALSDPVHFKISHIFIAVLSYQPFLATLFQRQIENLY